MMVVLAACLLFVAAWSMILGVSCLAATMS